MESAYYGSCTSSQAGGGIVIVKLRRVLVLGTYGGATTAAQAIPHVHTFVDNLEAVLSPAGV
jgi:hypothetical protein